MKIKIENYDTKLPAIGSSQWKKEFIKALHAPKFRYSAPIRPLNIPWGLSDSKASKLREAHNYVMCYEAYKNCLCYGVGE